MKLLQHAMESTCDLNDIINIEFNNIYRACSIILIVKPYCKREMNYSRKLRRADDIFLMKKKTLGFITVISVHISNSLISGRIF